MSSFIRRSLTAITVLSLVIASSGCSPHKHLVPARRVIVIPSPGQAPLATIPTGMDWLSRFVATHPERAGR
ncbi:hypothetical protein [Catenulispora rubra]|uniref:hypothetical protein n=1 Tax=Catenulispora rubra TaxID=280293 RepID=UPI001892031D|nr:hypothetical protein [Catenulispora rubra]